MAIVAYTGLPGSGKSYGVVANQILPALKAGRRVVTNIPLHMERIRRDIASGEVCELPIDRIAAQPDLMDEYIKPGDIVVMDEVWRLFPAGQKVNHVPEQYKKLLAEHRHMVDAEGRSTQICLVTQDLAQIGAFARQLVEQTFHHTKLGHLGMAGSFKCNIYHGSVTGANPPETNKLRTVMGKYDEKVYQYYSSHTMSQSGKEGADENKVDARGNIWKRPIIWVGGAFVIIAAIYAVYGLTSFFAPERYEEATRVSGPVSGASGATAATGRSQPTNFVPSPRSGSQSAYVRPRFRLSAIIDGAFPDAPSGYALLQDDQGGSVWIPREKCMFSRMVWRCDYQGEMLTLSTPPRPGQSVAPLASPMAAIGEAIPTT